MVHFSLPLCGIYVNVFRLQYKTRRFFIICPTLEFCRQTNWKVNGTKIVLQYFLGFLLWNTVHETSFTPPPPPPPKISN
jgi:hypothetical protein